MEGVGQLFNKIFTTGLALLPWGVSLYVLYRLEHDGAWSPETSMRELMSAGILALGLLGSFLLHSWMKRR